MKKQLQSTVKSTQRVAKNGETFIQATALLIVAGFSYYATRELNLNNALELIVVVSLVIIGLRGFYEFVKFLDRE